MTLIQISPSIPKEIIREILLILPVESLLRCKSVCKEWYYLISKQHFIKSHYTISSTINLKYQHHRFIYNTFEPTNNLKVCPLSNLMFDKYANNALLLKYPLQRTRLPRACRIVGSCNGLVCLFVDDVDYHLFIYNPSTRICNGLSFRRINSELGRYSFGYDKSFDDYKIVEVSTTKKVQIYSLKTGKWKNLGDFPSQYILNGCGTLSNGALHWLASYDDSTRQRIVSLDLAKETYGEVLQFEYIEGAMQWITLGVLGECLCGVSFCFESHAELWVMKVYGVKDSWTKLASFSYATNNWINEYPVPLFISNDGKVLIQCHRGLVIYDSKDSSISRIQDFKFGEACIVVESLVSPFPPLGLTDYNDDES